MAKKDADKAQLKETVEKHFDKIIMAAVMTPLGDPLDENCKWGLPSIFWGLSGIGKSERIFAAAQAVDLPCEVIYPGTRQPEDFSGALVPHLGGTRVECVLGAVRVLIAQGKGLLFVDEASCAVPAVQGAMLSMVNERRVGDDRIPNSVRILLAANPPEYAAGGWSLEAPFSNRMAHFFVGPPSVNEWADWLMTESEPALFSIEEAEARVKTNWNNEWSGTKGLMVSFMRANSKHMHNQPTPDHPDAGYAWPSPRTWWMAGRAVSAIRCLGLDSELEHIFVEACVGQGPANEWAEFKAKADLPDPKHALYQGWKIDDKRLDRTFAVYNSMTAYVLGTSDRQEQIKSAELLWQRLQTLCESRLADIALEPAKHLVRKGLGRKASPAIGEAAAPVLLRLGNEGYSKYIQE